LHFFALITDMKTIFSAILSLYCMWWKTNIHLHRGSPQPRN